MLKISLATEVQKANFKAQFAHIVKENERLNYRYTIQFFDTQLITNYVIKGLDGKSLNITDQLSLEELEKYRSLKHEWKNQSL